MSFKDDLRYVVRENPWQIRILVICIVLLALGSIEGVITSR